MKNVFSFTVVQTLKSTGIKVTTIIFCVIILLSMPVLHLMNKRELGGTKIEKVFIWDETGLSLGDFSGMKENRKYKDTEFSTVTSEEEVKGEGSALLLHITAGEAGYQICYVVDAESELGEMTVMELGDDFEKEFMNLREKSQNLTDEQKSALHTEVSKDVVRLEEDGSLPKKKEGGDELSLEQYNLFLCLIVLFVMLISFSAEAVSTSVITEKSNKLVENLMISVDTKELILGKVTGALAVTAIQLILMAACGFASAVISMLMFDLPKLALPEQMQGILGGAAMPNLNPFTLLLAVLSFLLGVLFFAMLAALFGASISKMEDMGEGMKVFYLLLIVGAYAAMFLKMGRFSGGGSTLTENIVGLIPFCSPFVIPGNLLTGEMPVLMAIGGIVIQVVALIFLTGLVVRVYGAMILYKGNVIKLRQIFAMAKGKEDAK